MKVVIFAGGYGTRITEETHRTPKPMIEIGGMPIIWHIMKFYTWYGFNDFIVCLGYKKEYIFDYFDNSTEHKSRELVIFEKQITKSYYSPEYDWKVTLVDTGIDTMTGGRLKRIKNLLNNETFLLTYGDTLSNVNLNKLLNFHKNQGVIATLTCVQPVSNYGIVTFQKNDNLVKDFQEKPVDKDKWINGGFYVLEQEVFSLISNDDSVFEIESLNKLVKLNKLSAYKHRGFWKSMETSKDKIEINDLWSNNKSEWNIWDHKLKKVL
ncbi:MAG: glucose-1-phosphate cytidylyltransferase [Ignavibacteriales bacterium]|nr:glucose-1-phosphate cytidylyltransferase [Ignavibacteriales bacterium]